MVHLILSRRMTRDDICGIVLILLAIWHVTHRAGVARLANGVLGSGGEERAWGAGRVGQTAVRLASRCLGLYAELVRSYGGPAPRPHGAVDEEENDAEDE